MTTTKNLLASTIESVVESLMQDRRTFCADDVLQIMLRNYKPVMKKYPLRSMRKFAALVRFTVTKLTATYTDYVATRLHPNPTLAPMASTCITPWIKTFLTTSSQPNAPERCSPWYPTRTSKRATE